MLARGTEEGTGTRLDHSFTVMTNRPIAFSLYSSIVRADRAGDLVSFSAADAIREHAPLVTVLRFGRKSRQAEIPVRLSITFTELGTLELWCESQVSDHRWRLQFQLRGHDEEQMETAAGAGEPAGGSAAGAAPAEAAEAIIHDEAIPEEKLNRIDSEEELDRLIESAAAANSLQEMGLGTA